MKKLLLVLLLLSSFPALANAWTITAKIGSPSGKITWGTQTVSSGTGYFYVPTGDTTVTVTPSSGYSVSLVTLDGTSLGTPPAGGAVTVPQGGRSSRTLIAYFTSASYTVTASQSAGGTLSLQQTAPTVGAISQTSLSGLKTGAVVKISASPNTDYTVTSLRVGNSTVWSGSSALPVIYNYTITNSSQTVSATYALIPRASANIVVGSTTAPVEASVSLNASASSTNDPPLSYLFSVASGDASKVTISPAGQSSSPLATFSASATGTYSVKVTITSAHGATSSATSPEITVMTQSAYDSGVCTSCHANRDSALVGAFRESDHYLSAGVSCSNCHNPDGTLGHPYLTNPANACQGCHATAVAEVSSSPHSQGCAGCHADHSVKADFNICTSCHSSVFGAGAIHQNALAVLAPHCRECHNPHTFMSNASRPHFSNSSSAQYITKNLGCPQCHNEVDRDGTVSFEIYDATREWARSGKGDGRAPAYMSYDFKLEGTPAPATPANSAAKDCVRCHTTTGYINYVTSNFQDIHAWGSSDDRTREMIACSTCHDPIPFRSYNTVDPVTLNVTAEAYSRRDIPAVTAYYNFSGAGAGRVLNAVPMGYDAGASNNCIACHSGTAAGSTLKALVSAAGAQGEFWNSTPLIDPHGMGAAGILFAKSGYEFNGRSYTGPLNYIHWSVGDGNPGSCVTCHMWTPKPHVFSAVSSAGGTITKITGFDDVCSYCHDNTTRPIPLNNPAVLDGKKQQYLSSLRVLRGVLAGKGIHFNPSRAPYFFSVAEEGGQAPGTAYKTWNSLYAAGSPAAYKGSDLMGAAFNLRLLWSEGGAYTHNSFYARRLIYDSIDLADNGLLDNSVALTIQNAAVTDLVSSDDKTRAASYVGARP
ncbi:hypothetical protein LPW11_16065 [Geomonas sp. RF6]|uniref:hypothetical protein n=1 Tax=Geomonas sp. RF6 TaxID=2897342 RepID=UPI001E5E5A13|nr:hypothetical protein [Geomonas sp. RF6]UFS69403.1 hypothetical protein LPW11_16065 [Geomonas sp. RF6]